MFELGRHGGYILASYAAAIVIIGALVAQTVAGYRSAKTRLGAAEGDE
jgi:heme exporter protein CcmD